MTDQGKATVPVNPGGTHKERYTIAINILIYAFVVISVITVVALLMIGLPVMLNYSPENAEAAYRSIKDLFAIVLPILGTWVGTILAFYFSQANFESATQSTINLHRQFRSSEEKLRTIKVIDKMIPMEQVSAKLTIEQGKSEKDYPLTGLITLLETGDKVPRQRLPVINDQAQMKYVIHRSLIDKFRSENVENRKLKDFTLQDMLDNDKYRAVLAAFGTVAPTANLADAKYLTDTIPDCSDVFVTENGQRESKALGWITNVDLAKAAVIENGT